MRLAEPVNNLLPEAACIFLPSISHIEEPEFSELCKTING
jgi:hypothetical protein